MALVNSGLAERLQTAVQEVRAAEAAAGDNPQPRGQWKALTSYGLLAMTERLVRVDGTNALDYDDEQRTPNENFLKSKTVVALAFYVSLLAQEPVRTWLEVEVLHQCLADLTTSEDVSWPQR